MKALSIDPDTILLQDPYDLEGLAGAIVDRHFPSLHYLAYSILGDADEADEAVQESVIRACSRNDCGAVRAVCQPSITKTAAKLSNWRPKAGFARLRPV